jgi:peptidoglycan-N-acetylglucosamine deacetylase
LNSDYPDLKVIVVDDGSTDDTSDNVRAEFGQDPRVTLICKQNGGKSTALNLGISKADTEILVCLDADTMFAKDTISHLVPHFADPKVGAVAGNVKVGNRTNPLTIWQSLEYITTQNFDRRAYAMMNSVSVVPGAVGAWRKSAILEAGSYGSDTLAEDTDLTYRIRLLGYHIHTENRALAYTEAPDTVQTLAKQRFRWAFGTLQSLWKHRRAMFNPRHGWFGMFVMPATWVFSIVFQAISPIVDIMIIVALFNQGFVQVFSYYAAFFVLDFIGASIAIRLDSEDERQLVWLFWQRFFYRQFMCFVVLKALFTALRGSIVGWGKLHRRGTVTAPT